MPNEPAENRPGYSLVFRYRGGVPALHAGGHAQQVVPHVRDQVQVHITATELDKSHALQGCKTP